MSFSTAAPSRAGSVGTAYRFSSSAEAPACSISRAKSIHPPGVVPLSEAMTGTFTAARIFRSCSRYRSGPIR